MSNDGIPFLVNVSNLIVDKDELSELVAFLRSKKYLHKNYKGNNKGFAGGEWDYNFEKVDNKVEIKPIDEAVWLYLNTFGKETE